MKKEITMKKVVQYFLSDIGVGFLTGMIANYLLYFYQPTIQSGLPHLLPASNVGKYITIMALITGIGKALDAVTDPIVANWSDKCKHPSGRRVPFLKWTAIPYALSCLMIFFAPFEQGSVGNAIWVAFFVIAYYLAYTIYRIPQRALVPEIIVDPHMRVKAYTISAVFFMGGSSIMYAVTLFVGFLKNGGISALWAWRICFIVLAVIAAVLLMISAFAIKEKDYVVKEYSRQDKFLKSFKKVITNKTFVLVTMGDLCNSIAMAFFQTALMYYITVLLGVPEDQSIIIMATAIACAGICFPFIIKISKVKNKKLPLLIAGGMFTVLFTAIFFGDKIGGPPIVKGVIMGILVAFPFASVNMLPSSIVSDVIQEDTLRTGVNKEAMFMSAKTFIEKLSYAVAMVVVASVLAVGAATGEKIGLQGVKLTGLCAGIFSLLSFIIYCFYNDNKITANIRRMRDEKAAEEAAAEDGGALAAEMITENEVSEII